MPADQGEGRTERLGLAARDQARRLSPNGAPDIAGRAHQGPARLRWTDRFALITEAAERLCATTFVLDGEGVILRQDSVADFDRLHSRRHDGEVQLLGFDLLELDGTDLRAETLARRKAALAKLLRRSQGGIQIVEHIEAADGTTVFEHACKLGLEGIVSKARDLPYQHGRSRAWLKIKNPASPAMQRVWEDRF